MSIAMKVAIRVDASKAIGSGHVARCLSLADELTARGAVVYFVSGNLPRHLYVLVVERGHEVIELPSPRIADEEPEAAWALERQCLDAHQTLAALAAAGMPELMIVDHYGLDIAWEDLILAQVPRLLVIDDISRAHHCDLLLDQNIHSSMQDRYKGKVPGACQLLLGPEYALLRHEFRHLHERTQLRDGRIRRIFVLLGGSDPYDLTSRAIEAIHAFGQQLRVDIVIGAEHPNGRHIESLCSAWGYDCHIQTPHVAELMAAADVAIGAGGSSSWERCCVALPSICVAFADNQLAIGEALEQAGVSKFLGHRFAATREKMTETLHSLRAMPEQLREMSRKAFSLVDGQGCSRVCEALGAP